MSCLSRTEIPEGLNDDLVRKLALLHDAPPGIAESTIALLGFGTRALLAESQPALIEMGDESPRRSRSQPKAGKSSSPARGMSKRRASKTGSGACPTRTPGVATTSRSSRRLLRCSVTAPGHDRTKSKSLSPLVDPTTMRAAAGGRRPAARGH